MAWLVVKFPPRKNGDKETVEAVPASWVCNNQCYWPSFPNSSDTAKAIKSCWSPDKLKWEPYAITVLSNKACSSFAVACKKATKALSSSDVDTTEGEELPLKRRTKSNKRYSLHAESSHSDDDHDVNDDVPDYPCPPIETPKNQPLHHANTNSQSQHCSQKTISSHHQLPSKQITIHDITDGTDRPGDCRSSKGSSEISIDSILDDTLTSDNIESAPPNMVEHKIDELTKLIIKNNRLIKHQTMYIEQLEKKIDSIKDGASLNRTISCQPNEDLEEITRLFPLKTEDDLNLLEGFIKSSPDSSLEENKKKEDIRNQLAKSLSLDGSSNYKEAVRRIMSTVISDQLAHLFSYKGHKGKKKFYEKTVSAVIITSVQICHRKTTEDGLLKKNIENEIALWLSKAAERLKKRSHPN